MSPIAVMVLHFAGSVPLRRFCSADLQAGTQKEVRTVDC
jgi:hypothetical protein